MIIWVNIELIVSKREFLTVSVLAFIFNISKNHPECTDEIYSKAGSCDSHSSGEINQRENKTRGAERTK